MPDWQLKEMTGDYSQYDYQLPSDTMYDVISRKGRGSEGRRSMAEVEAEAQRLYDKYANSPYSGDSLKGKTYKGVYIPKPNYSLNETMSQMIYGKDTQDRGPDNPITVAAPQIAIDAISDIPGELGELATAGWDKLFGTNLTPKVQSTQNEYLPKMRVESGGGRFAKEGSQTAIGTLVGGSLLKGVGYAGQFIGAILGGAVTRDDEDTSTLIFGENSLLGSDLSPVTADEKDAAGKVLERRLNLLLDDAVAGTVGEGLIRGGAFLTKTMYGVTLGRALPYFDKNKRALKVMEHVASMLKLADDAATPQEQKRILNELADYMSDPNNQKLVYNLPDSEIEKFSVNLDSMAVLRRSDLTSDVTKDNAAVLARKGDQTRSIAEATDDFTSRSMDALGRDAPESTKSILDDIATTEVNKARGQAETIAGDLDLLRKQLVEKIGGDPTLGESLTKVAKNLDINADELVNANTEKLTDITIDAYRTAKKALDEKAALVKKGPKINLPEMSKMQELVAEAINAKSLSRSLQTIMERAGNDAVDWAMNVRPQLSAEISRIYKGGGTSVADANFLKAIRDEIDSQMNVLAKSDGIKKSATGQAFLDFHDYYKNKWAPVWTEGILGDAADILRDSPIVRFGRSSTNTLNSIDQAIASGMTNFRFGPEFVTNMRNAGYSTDDIVNYMVGKSSAAARKQLIDSGEDIENFSVDALASELSKYGAAFKEVDPEVSNGLNKFLVSLQSDIGDINKVKEILKEAEKKTTTIEDAYKGSGGAFGEFYSQVKNPSNLDQRYALTGDATGAMSRIFKDTDNSINKIQKILEETSINGKNDPTVLAGLQVSWVDALRKEIIDNSTGAFNVRGTKLLLDDNSLTSFLKVGEEIFQDKPELLALYKNVLKDALYENAPISKQLSATLNLKGVDTDVAAAAHILTTWTFGVLNRTAARVRSGVGGVLAINKSADSVDAIYSQILNDPQYFADTLRKMADTIKAEGPASQAMKEMLWDVFTRVQSVGSAEPQNMENNKTFNDLLNEIQTDLATSDTRSK